MGEEILTHVPDADSLALDVLPSPGTLTEDQLQARHEMVRLHTQVNPYHETSESDLTEVEQLMQMSPDEAHSKLDDEREKAVNGEYSPFLESYKRYVETLRNIRKDQRDYIKERLEFVKDEPEEVRREEFLQALEYSPPLARKVLDNVNPRNNPLDSSSLPPLLSSEQIAGASKTKEGFQQAITQMAMREPRLFISQSKIFEQVLDSDTLKIVATSLLDSHPDQVIHSPESFLGVLEHCSKEDRATKARELLDQISISGDSSQEGYKLIDIISSSDVIDLIGLDAAREIADRLIVKGDCLPRMPEAGELIDKGILTREDISSAVMKKAIEDFSDHGLSTYLGEDSLLDQSERDIIGTMVVERIRQTGSRKLYLAREILSEQDFASLSMELFERDPIEYIKNVYDPLDGNVPIERITGIVREMLGQGDTKLVEDSALGDIILNSNSFSDQEKRRFVEMQLAIDPSAVLSALGSSGISSEGRDSLESIFSPEELEGIVRKYVNNEVLVFDILRLMDYIPQLEDKRQFLLDYIENSDSINTVTSMILDYRNKTSDLFSEEELMIILEDKLQSIIDGGEGIISSWSFRELNSVLGDAKCRELVNYAMGQNPGEAIKMIGSVSYLFSAEELQNMIRGLASDENNIPNLLEAIEYNWLSEGYCWASYVDKKIVSRIILSNIEMNTDILIRLGLDKKLEQFLSQEEMQVLCLDIIKSNPASAITGIEFLSKYIRDVSVESIIETAINDEVRMAIAGKFIKETFGRVLSTDKESTKDLLLKDGEDMYNRLSLMLKNTSAESLIEQKRRLQLSANQERELVDSLSVLVSIAPEMASRIGTFESVQAIEEAVITELAKEIGIDTPIGQEQIDNIAESLGGITNLAIYIEKYHDSDSHIAVLRPMFEAVLNGNFDNWKFGLDDQDSLSAMQEMGLLPKSLSLEQYRQWRVQTESSHGEVDTVYERSVIGEIRRVLTENAVHLPERSILREADDPGTIMEETAEILSQSGRRVADIHKEIKILNNQPDQDAVRGQVEELRAELSTLQNDIKLAQLKQDITQLMTITEEDIRASIIGGKKNGRSIEQILNRLRKNIGGEIGFVVEQIETVFESYRGQTGAIQRLQVIDTADPRVTLEIGSRPVGSCQNYRTGVMNEALIGYFDPNTKIILVLNERGNPIARSVFRILDSSEEPSSTSSGMEASSAGAVLHIETVYSIDASDGVVKSVLSHAISKGQSMGLPVMISLASQDDEGHMAPARDVEGIQRDLSKISLQSRGSRAPFVYVDSVGGMRKGGVYIINGLAQVSSVSV